MRTAGLNSRESLSNTVAIFPATGPLPAGSRRRRLVLKPTQKRALQALFQQNPYPGISTRERLARELDIPESRIQVGFSISFVLPGGQGVDTIRLKPLHVKLLAPLASSEALDLVCASLGSPCPWKSLQILQSWNSGATGV